MKICMGIIHTGYPGTKGAYKSHLPGRTIDFGEGYISPAAVIHIEASIGEQMLVRQ